MFEDSSPSLKSFVYRRSRIDAFSTSLSKASRALEKLSGALLVDASAFFSDFMPYNQQPQNIAPWTNLRNLALTSRTLKPREPHSDISMLLQAAGHAAAFMPKLEIMEIWHGGEENKNSIFRYKYNSGEPEISWTSDWITDFQLDDDLIHCWEQMLRVVGLPHTSLTTRVIRLPWCKVKTRAAAIFSLELRLDVLHPISYDQIMMEEQVSLQLALELEALAGSP